MNVNDRIWNTTRTGTKVHAFQDGTAVCRTNIRDSGKRPSVTYTDARRWVADSPGLSFCLDCAYRVDFLIKESKKESACVHQAHADAPCCEHASMHHGAKGCDECSCTTARSDTTAHQGAVTDTTTEENSVTNPRPITGPLTRRQTQVMDLLLDDRRQTEVATTLGVSAPYVSEEAQIASRKLKARTTNGGVANYATAKAYIQAAELIEGHRSTEPDKELNGVVVDAVLSGIANILRERAGRLLPQ